jgi:hypothetical protein
MPAKGRMKIISLKSLQYKTFLISFILPSFILISFLLTFFIRQELKSQERERANTLSVLSAHLNNDINSDLELSLSYLFDTDILNFFTFLSNHDYEKNAVDYNQYLNAYTKSLSIYTTLLKSEYSGSGIHPLWVQYRLIFLSQEVQRFDVYKDYDYRNRRWYQQLQFDNHSVIYTKEEISDVSGRQCNLNRAYSQKRR